MTELKPGDSLDLKISQGCVLVSDFGCEVVSVCDDCILVYVDLSTKYAAIAFVACGMGNGEHFSGPTIYLEATDETLNLSSGHSNNELTCIEFPQLKGWRIFASTLGRYTLNIAFKKEVE